MNDTKTNTNASLEQGFCVLPQAVDSATVRSLSAACEQAFTDTDEEVRPRSSRGHVYAARNLIDGIPEVRTFWRHGVLMDFLRRELGDGFGLVRVLFFDKPPDRTWALPWHKDTAIAVQDNSIVSDSFSRPTVKAGVPHVVANEPLLRTMLTLRVHLDEVTGENGPLKVLPNSHDSKTSEGVGIDSAVTIYADVGDVLAMRPMISHASGASAPETRRHRRILHLEFATDQNLPDGYCWHDFVPGLPEEVR